MMSGMVPLALVLGGTGLLLYWSACLLCRKAGAKAYAPVLPSRLTRRGVRLYVVGLLMTVAGIVLLGVQLLFW